MIFLLLSLAFGETTVPVHRAITSSRAFKREFARLGTAEAAAGHALGIDRLETYRIGEYEWVYVYLARRDRGCADALTPAGALVCRVLRKRDRIRIHYAVFEPPWPLCAEEP